MAGRAAAPEATGPDLADRLGAFLRAARIAYAARTAGRAYGAMVARAFDALPERPLPCGTDDAVSGSRPAVCRHLAAACDPAAHDTPDLAELARSFLAVEPALTWRRRAAASPAGATPDERAFARGHANALIVGGAGSLICHRSVSLGVSLLAPGLRYPDHSHPPEEIYLALGRGAFGHGQGDDGAQGDGAEEWHETVAGGIFHNPPGIVHRMRAGPSAPFLAFWLLLLAP